ncbi:LVIVD repeat-containing protein [Niabella ginsengisoli]|uniref:LVIVD repeat-containing protein n=1 Tax=Niabella ginsengisoli TaxID=522298 RepID=A0ABS9SJA7_9BACT|nr:hypothetical protein [Niabella ginsengisoli]MCH5598452.1 hypothetical protein [Niabella ginsengisoli]
MRTEKQNFTKLAVPTQLRLPLLSIMLLFIAQSCLKDNFKSTRYVTLYTPVTKTLAEVRSDVQLSTPIPLKNPSKIYVKGNYLLISETWKGVHIIDNTDPSNPKNIGFIKIPGNVDMATKNNSLYADMNRELWTIDISDPTAPSIKNIIENVFPWYPGAQPTPLDAEIVVDYIVKDTVIETSGDVVEEDGQQIVFFDATGNLAFSNSASGAVGAIYGTGGSMARFAALKERLFTVDGSGLSIFNITADMKPEFVQRKQIGWLIETIYPFKENLYIGSLNGMYIYDLANPNDPTQLSSVTHVRSCDPVVANETHAFVTLRNGTRCWDGVNELQIYSTASLTSPTLLKKYPMTSPHGLGLSGNLLFICDGKDGLKIYDITDVNDLKLVKHIKGLDTFDVIPINGIAIVSGESGIYQYDYRDPNNIKLISTIDISKK